jgi:PAS domain S-box-containing protein
MELALAKSEARFQMIFQRAFFGILLVNMNGRVVVANPAFLQMLGLMPEDIERQDLFEHALPEDAGALREQFARLTAQESDHFLTEARFARKNGDTAWLRLAMSLFQNQGAGAVYVVGMVEDITAQRTIEAELAELQRRLLESAESERLHLAQELHDGPLQDLYALSFQLQALENSDQPPKVLEEAGEMIRAVHEISVALRAMTGELRPPALAPYGLEKAIRSHTESVRDQHPDLTVQLELDEDRKLLPERVRLALFRIYQQAISNALRHSGASRITVRFRLDPERVVLEVQDNGRGFNPPPRTIDLVRTGHFGLAGSIERAESIGARMEVISKRGAGTTIRVVVPRQEEFQVAPRERYSTWKTAR